MRRIPRAIVPAFVRFAPAAFAQDSLLGADALATDSGRFRLKVEMKMNARTSTSIEFPVANTGAPFPVVLETVSPHTSAELSNISLTAEGDLTPDILAKVVIHFLDLYIRNPPSSSDRIFVREAFARFCAMRGAVKEMPATVACPDPGIAPAVGSRSRW